jgi:FAD/FMN-containing dehydrogenase
MAEAWRNWSGSVACTPERIVLPTTEASLAAAVAAGPAPVRVVGTGHSFTPLGESSGTLISLDDLAGIVATDALAETATIWAGSKLHAIGEPLLAAGLALENMGDIDRQSLGGVVGTGTHGTGPTLGNFSSQVVGLRLVLADGGLLDCSTDHEPEVFAAARLALGALGIISRVTLRVLPAYRLHQQTWAASFEECLAQLPARTAATRHFEFFWSPTDDACALKALHPTDLPCGEIAPAPAATGRLPRYLVPERVDWSYRIFPSERTLLFNEMEFAVPAESGPDCLRELRDLMLVRYPDVFWPVEYRTLAADDIPLSPAYGRATVTISIHQAVDLPREAFFADAEAIFRNHRGRPHWGKLHTFVARELREAYPQFDAFRAVRERLDPGGRFLNAHLRSLFVD